MLLSKKNVQEYKQKAFDLEHKKTISSNVSEHNIAMANAKQKYIDLELAKQRASYIKQHAIDNLDKYLKEFEVNISKRGAEVVWAEDANQAINEISNILKSNNAKLVVKSKSATTDEINLKDLEDKGIKITETKLNEYIMQLANQESYNTATSCTHKSPTNTAKLLKDKFNILENSTPEFIAKFVSDKLREDFVKADAGITGANFIIADKGAICLTENEGNAMMSFSMPRIHIVIAGIEKLIPRMQDLALFWPLLSTHRTRQQFETYNSIILGPRQNDEIDGPEKMFVILLDNKRSDLYNKDKQYEALKCISCGACFNICPNINKHIYNSNHREPIETIIASFRKGSPDYNNINLDCSLCEKCSEVCPTKISLHKLMPSNYKDTVKQKSILSTIAIRLYKKIFSRKEK